MASAKMRIDFAAPSVIGLSHRAGRSRKPKRGFMKRKKLECDEHSWLRLQEQRGLCSMRGAPPITAALYFGPKAGRPHLGTAMDKAMEAGQELRHGRACGG